MSSTVLLLIVTLCNCTNASKDSTTSASPTPEAPRPSVSTIPEPLRTLSSDLTIVKSTGQLPNSCKMAFAGVSKQARFEMAEPGQRFQVSDVVLEHLPWRRLVFGGISGDRCLIHYERGGRGHMYLVVSFALSGDGKGTFLWGGSVLRTEPSLNQLRDDIANGKLKILLHDETGW